MATRTADAEWRGNLAQGSGHMRLGSGAFEGSYDFRSRMGEGNGTNPEELLGAAHAGCFSMALALELTNAGFTVKHIHTRAKVHFEERDGGWSIHRIDLDTEGSVSNCYGGGLRGMCAERQEKLPSFASPVRRRHPSASQAPLSSALRYRPSLHFSFDAQIRW